MKKKAKTKAKQKRYILSTLLMMSYGVLYPLQGTVYASEQIPEYIGEGLNKGVIAESTGITHYINGSQYGDEETFMGYEDRSMVKNTDTPVLKSIQLAEFMDGSFLYWHKEDDVYESYPDNGLGYKNYRNIFWGDDAENIFVYEKGEKSTAETNALVGRFYENGNYVYKVIGTVNSADDAMQSSQFKKYINDNILNNVTLQMEWYKAIGSGNQKVLANFIDRYIPHYYLVNLSEEELEKYKELEMNEDYFADGSMTVNDIFLNGQLGNEYLEITANNQFMPGDNLLVNGSEDKTTHNYNSVKVEKGGYWTPLDRTISTKGPDLEGDYSMPQFWVTGQNGTIPNSEQKPPVSTDGNSNNYIIDEHFDGLISPIKSGSKTAITVADLQLGDNSTVDLSYANTVMGRLMGNWSIENGSVFEGSYEDANGTVKQAKVDASRTLIADKAVLGQDTTFRLGIYDVNAVGWSLTRSSSYDSVYIYDLQSDTGEKNTVHLQLGWVPGIGNSLYGAVAFPDPDYSADYTNSGIWSMYNPKLFNVYEGAENIDVVADVSRADGIDNIYEITPEIGRLDDYFTTENSHRLFMQNVYDGYIAYVDPNTKSEYCVITTMPDGTPLPTDQSLLTEEQKKYLIQSNVLYGEWEGNKGSVWYLKGYTYVNTGEIGISGRAAADQALTVQNLWRESFTNMFRRTEDLHMRGTVSPDGITPALAEGEDGRENIWASSWHSKSTNDSGYGRSVSQSYNGYQVGFDKLLRRQVLGGKIYAGAYLSKVDSTSNMDDGKGDADGIAIGIYNTWVRDDGRYFDVGLNVGRMADEYHFNGPMQNGSQGIVKGDYHTWGYGIGMKYGKRNEKGDFWWDPQASLFIGHMDGSSYTLENGLDINAKDWNTAIARLGVTTGKKLGEKGQVWAGVNINHDFGKGQEVYQSFGAKSGTLEGKNNTDNLNSVGWQGVKTSSNGNDTWFDIKAGGDIKLSRNTNLHAEYSRDIGKKEGNKWSVSGRIDISFSGIGGSGRKAAEDAAAESVSTDTGRLTGQELKVSDGQRDVNGAAQMQSVAPVVLPKMENSVRKEIVDVEANESSSVIGGIDENDADAIINAIASGVSESAADASGELSFELPAVTVEGNRLGWEQELSPGQVSVIYTKQFVGEQRDLPELLDRVPGLFVNRSNGQGHYTTANVRGSTAGQVSVYVDGVKINLNGDAAVNLSAIPADNIERIEVYRGYVPARFSGAPIGGVINIVTKKPNSGHGHVSYGMRSYGGWSQQYEYSTPLGDGSLLATFSKEMWDGNYRMKGPDPKSDRFNKNYISYERRSNDLNNSNGMIKWQNDNWVIKGAWKNLHEGLAASMSTSMNNINNWGGHELGFTDAYQDLNYKEFYIGRQDTFGKLAVDWHVAYMDNDKQYRNTGAMKQINYPFWPPNDWDIWKQQPKEDDYMPGQLWGNYRSRKWNANLSLTYNLWDSHLLEFNGDISWDNMDVTTNGQDKSQEKLDYDSITGGRPWRQLLRNYRNREYHFTLQDTVNLDDKGDLKITAIGRAEKVLMQGLGPVGDQDDRWMYSGGFALNKKISDKWSLKTTWGTYNRHPNFYEIFGDGITIFQSAILSLSEHKGIDNGTWETGTQFDLGVQHLGHMFGAESQTILGWFQRKAKNQLVLWQGMAPGVNWSNYMPTGETTTHGVELTHNMKWDRVNLQVSGTWETARNTRNNVGAGYAPISGSDSFVPEWLWNVRLDYTFPGDRLTLFGEYHYKDEQLFGSTYVQDGENFYLAEDSYGIFNVGLKYKFGKNLRLVAGINDIQNKGYNVWAHGLRSGSSMAPSPLKYPLMGRNYYMTMEYSF